MDNNFVNPGTRKAEAKGKKPFEKAWLAILGFASLGGPIGLIQSIAKRFANDPDHVILIENWLPWIAVLFLALGWYTIHWFEIELLKKRFGTAVLLLLLAVWVIGSFSISFYFQFFTDNEVLHDFAHVSIALFISGYCLRFSTFRNESFLLLNSVIPRQKS